jgi:hypothetical protein
MDGIGIDGRQIKRVLELVEEKGVSREEVQFLLESGAFSDLLEALKSGRLQALHRQEWRVALGLDRLCPPGRFFCNRLSFPPVAPPEYTLQKDQPIVLKNGRVELEVVEILLPAERILAYDAFKERALQKAGKLLGQRDAEVLLGEKQDIPQEWRTIHFPFLATEWLDSQGRRRTPILLFKDGDWQLSMRDCPVFGPRNKVLRLV